MTAPDELRQLADRLIERARLEDMCHGGAASVKTDDDRAAAVALRHHANLTATPRCPEHGEMTRFMAHDRPTLIACFLCGLTPLDLLAEAAVSPPPAPTTYPTCRSDDPLACRLNSLHPHPLNSMCCPDSWHQQASS
jgi:hypothetical protein